MPPAATPLLLSISLSHFCETARWALERAGIRYRERAYLPLVHRVGTRRYGARSVPVLVCGATVLRDSNAIIAWADAQPGAVRLLPVRSAAASEAHELLRYLDRELGLHARRWAYGHLLSQSALLRPCFTHGVAAPQRYLAPLVWTLARPLIRRGYRVTPPHCAESLERVSAVFDRMAERLADGRPYLLEEGFGAGDITFAALAAPLLVPENYGGRLPPLAQLPAPMRAVTARLRAHPAGAFALAMYARHRGGAR
ncbi:MAG: glutathione S-transferase N-terminal domain-containing protein [Gammaproteobacteria bacterium]|nr:glutathione S-transferase N-terminal domain-containing protein [Gammaproteobacteria bacterium]